MSFGKILKQKREDKKVTILEVANATKIKEVYLQAFEEEDFTKMPIEPYATGFLKNYISYLGIKDTEIYKLYLELKKNINYTENSKEKFINEKTNHKKNLIKICFINKFSKIDKSREYKNSHDKKNSNISNKRRKVYFKILNIFSFIILIFLLMLLTFSFFFLKEKYKYIVEDIKNIDRNIQNILKEKPNFYQKPIKEILSLDLYAKQNSWLDIKVDNRNFFNGTLKKGDNLKIFFFDTIDLLIGNVDFLEANLNGRKMDIRKDSNKNVNKIVLNYENYNSWTLNEEMGYGDTNEN
ncbi:MAG: DUF4115 domain-containing protein [Elusimicrobiota bacterium]|jgi:transcriptional regulator with XRE-family HTH domain|nr:DUF4115 domain-containing protein [Elusimicrobiota bacterium]